MKSKRIYLFSNALLILFCLSFSFVDLDPMYIEKFGYGSICASNNGYPEKDKYVASQYDFKDGKFFVKREGRLDLRAILPQGKTYGDLLNEFKSQNSSKYTDVIYEAQFWIAHVDHLTYGGIQTHWGAWPTDPGEMVKEQGMTFTTSLTGEVLDWNTAGLKWDQMENNFQSTVGTWLDFAEPGWQIYILHTVGWERWRPEDKYWDEEKGKYITPTGYELAPPIGYCIVEVK